MEREYYEQLKWFIIFYKLLNLVESNLVWMIWIGGYQDCISDEVPA